MSARNYKITIAGQTFNVEVGDISSSPIDVKVDGTTFRVELPDLVVRPTAGSAAPSAPEEVNPEPRPVVRPSIPAGDSDGVIRAPMPGKIVNVNVSVGETVAAGQAVLVLESMKMENTITSPIDGTVSVLLVTSGDAVLHGQTLIEIGQA